MARAAPIPERWDRGNYFDGGKKGGWTDTIRLEDADGGSITVDWTVQLDHGKVVGQHAGTLDLSQDASGTLQLADGSTMHFEGIEKIVW
jgi:hypothetical protein